MAEEMDRLTRGQRRAWIIIGLAAALGIVFTILPASTRLRLWVGLLDQRGLLVLLAAFSLLSLSLVWSAGQRIDAWVFLYFNRHKLRKRWLDLFMWGVTQIGNGATGFALALAFYFLGYRRLGIEFVLGTLSLWLVVELIKAITDRSRPFLKLEEIRVVGWKERGRSFPSGHTSQTFFIMGTLVHFFHTPLWITVFLYAVAITVGFTRVYVGVHYPRDVIGGALLGSVWSVLAALLDPYLASRLF